MYEDLEDLEQEDSYAELNDNRLAEEEVKRDKAQQARIAHIFENMPKQGIHAHAYNDKYDNFKIYQLKQRGKSLQQIADVFGCSKSTIRNRLNKINGAHTY